MIAMADPISATDTPDHPAQDGYRMSPEEITERLDPVRAQAEEEGLIRHVEALSRQQEDERLRRQAAMATVAPVPPKVQTELAAPTVAQIAGGFTGLSQEAEAYLAVEVASTSLTSPDPAHPVMSPVAVRRRNQAMIQALLKGNGAQAILASQVIQLQTGLTRVIAGMEMAQDAAGRAIGAVAAAKLAKATTEHLRLLDRLQRPRKRRVAKVEVQRGGQAIVGDVHVGAK